MYGGEDDERVEAFDHNLDASVGEYVHAGQHDAEAMEEWDAAAELVVSREAHSFAGEISIVGNVMMGEHDAFGEACCAGGVLHVDYVVAVDVLFGFVEGCIVNVFAQEEEFGGVVHAAVFFLTDIDDVLHLGEAVAAEVSSLLFFQFGEHGVDHVNVASVEYAFSDAERVQISVLDEIFQFALLVIRIDGDEHGSYLGSGIEEGEPVGDVGRPYPDMGSFAYADGQHAFGHTVNALVEDFPGEAKVAVGIYDVFLVGRLLCPVFKPLSKGAFLQFHILLIGGINNAEDACRIAVVGMYVVSDNGIVVYAVAFFEHVGVLAVVDFYQAVEDEDKFFAFVR